MSGIITHKRSNPFVQIDKRMLSNEKLSWKAKGILAYLLSKPDGWITYLKDLENRSLDGRDSVRAGMQELEILGYIEKKRIRKNGQFKGWEYKVYELPKDFIAEVGKTDFGTSNVGETDVGKPAPSNNELSNNELSNNELSNNELKNKYVGDLFNHYISKDIIRHNKLTDSIKRAINARLKDFSFEELKQAIDNYAIVYASDKYWFTYKYSIIDLMREKDVVKFLDAAEPLKNFLKDNSNKQKTPNNNKPSRYEDW